MAFARHSPGAHYGKDHVVHLKSRPQCIANWSDPEYTYLGVCSLISEYYLFITTLIFLTHCSKIINKKQLHQRINNFCVQFV